MIDLLVSNKAHNMIFKTFLSFVQTLWSRFQHTAKKLSVPFFHKIHRPTYNIICNIKINFMALQTC